MVTRLQKVDVSVSVDVFELHEPVAPQVKTVTERVRVPVVEQVLA